MFLKAMCDHAKVVIIADEGILEYENETERIRNCQAWYGFVIAEAKRRGLTRLAEMESRFLEHERLSTADDAGDYKESPSQLVADAQQVGLRPTSIDRQGPWKELGGGFFTVTFKQ
jgi:hypothetical protein